MLDKEFQQELLDKLNDELYDCRKILFKYKKLGMKRVKMYKNMESLRIEFREKDDENSEDNILDLMDYVWGWCHSSNAIFETYLTSTSEDDITATKFPEFKNS